jgi:hypothetical protein
MNYMKQIAEMLGLKWDDENNVSEEFEIIGQSENFKITPSGLAMSGYGYMNYSYITNLLTGNIEIKRKPWKPKLGEYYYLPDYFSKELFSGFTWRNDKSDNMYFERNLVCKTAEEAISIGEKVIDALRRFNLNYE